MPSIDRIFVIGNEEREPERCKYLTSYFNENNIQVEWFQPTYSSCLTSEELDTYVSTNWSLHNRPLRMSEISLFLNFIYIFKRILSEHKKGHFLILESDVIFYHSLSLYLEKLLPHLETVNADCASIGMGCNLLPPKINHLSSEFQLVKMTKTRCTDALLFSYAGIQKFMKYFDEFMESFGSINEPIDNFFETFFRKDLSYQYIWVYPSICVQGSQTGQYTSSIQPE